MPAPWVQSALNPGWLASQVYPEGTTIEFEANDGGIKAHGRALASVIGTRGERAGETWLTIQVRCVEIPSFLMWLGKGPGAKFKGVFELHLCQGETGKCTQKRKDEVSELHTDTMRVVEVADLKERVGDWWTTANAVDDFESFRRKTLRARSAEEESPAVGGPPRSDREDDRMAPGALGPRASEEPRASPRPVGRGDRRKRRWSR